MPSPAMARRLSRQRTRPVTCSTRRTRKVSGALSGAAVTLLITGTAGALISTSASAAATASAAGASSRQWNGALTGSSTLRRAPCCLASSTAR